VFSNGWIEDFDGTVFIYFASSDTRMHVAKTTVEKLVDYCMNSPQDKLYSHLSVQTINDLVDRNQSFMDLV
jgi:4-O-beta-D-mannosyl-D-glucose phosphorylase